MLNKIFKRILLPVLLLVVLPLCAFAQKANVSIKGTVTDATGDPLIGVTIVLDEARIGTITDVDGFYNLSGIVNLGTYTLKVSYVGYTNYATKLDVTEAGLNITNDVTLRPDILELDQVIVTGASPTSTRKQLGNNISVVSGASLTTSGTTNTLGALSGKVMGAQISQNDGNPAGGISIRLRGPSSVNGSSDPLYIVDGVIVDNSSSNVINLNADAMTTGLQAGQNRLIDINPNDIERIEVLNGASAAALYGSRAANGVVQIFTKRGKSGKATVEFSTSVSVSQLRKKVFMTEHPERFGVPGNERLELTQDRLTTLLTLGLTEARLTTDGVGFTKVGPVNRLLVTDTYAVERFDMQDEIFTTALGTENNLSVSGGNDKTNYFASFGYTNNDGIIQNTNFTKYTGRLRLNQTLAEWASVSAGISYNYSLSQDLPNGNNFFSPISTMFIIDNVWDITERDEGGNLKQVELVRVNPLTVTETFDITQTTNRSIGDVQLNLYPFKGFSVNAILGYDTYSLVGNEFRPRIPYPGVAADFFPDGYVSYATSNVFLLNHDLTANYTKEFGDFTSTTTAGYQIQNSNSQFTSQAGRDLAPLYNDSAAANLFSAPRQSIAERNIWGYFLQQTVGYKDQVFVTLAGRIDGSSVFSTDNQNIFYPKASASWVLTDYFKDSGVSSFLSSAKLRASYGQAGNLTGIGAYDRYNNYLTAQLSGLTAVQPSTVLANPNVKPELMTEFEFGADLAFADNRVGLNITVYNQDIEDLLLTRPLPPTAGGNSIITNEGSMTNKGLEVMLQASPVLTDKVQWNIGVLYSSNRNEVSGIDGVLALRGSGGAQSAINGQPYGVFYGTYYARNAQGDLLLTSQGLAQPERGSQSSILAGTPTLNADGQPNGTELRKIIGDPNPDWYGTVTSDLKVGKLSFRVQFDAIWGFDVYNWNRITGNNVGHGKLAEKEIKGELPRGYVASIAGGVTGGRIQEEHVEDGSFVKLRELSLGYDLGKIGTTFSNVNLSIIGRNLISFDDYEGFDPETNSAGQTDRVRGDDFGNVPIPRMIQFRLGAKF
ncbi:MAG: SusC/RagA family TonB-linked outer membrane protein [Saprospiraceae bacterium]|nr:SusC/RagA family TonB-linked outer membrane protein [Saprospiraceae bacterium]